MSIDLDHLIVPSHDRRGSAKWLAELLDVAWGEPGVGFFAAVYLNDSLTLDFMDVDGPISRNHYCFRVDDERFDAILERLESAGIRYRSEPMGPVDSLINTRMGGRNIYWNKPDGHQWEILTVSYARRRSSQLVATL